MKSKELSQGRCPKCGYIFSESTNLDDENLKPREGDISFCIKCGAVNIFDGVGVVPCDESTLDEETKGEIAKLKNAWLKVKGKRHDRRSAGIDGAGRPEDEAT